MKPTVYLTRLLPDEILNKLDMNTTLRYFPESERAVPRGELLEAVRGVEGILSMITDQIDAEVLDAAGSQLKVVANMGVGYDNVVLEAAKERGVMVTNTPDVLNETTADLTFALMLATARRLVESELFLREGNWKVWSPMDLTGQDVFGATLGIIGMGRIGEAIVKRAIGFDMKVVYHNRSRRPEVEAKYGCTYHSMDEVLQAADFVLVMTPLTNETRGLIGARELSLMKPTAIFINTSRGPVVDEEALYQALLQRQIWAAGLDVFAQEPIAPNHPLLTLDNVVLLPHIGSASIKTRMRMAHLAADNLIAAVTEGQPPTRVV